MDYDDLDADIETLEGQDAADRFYGKYRGLVSNNQDPLNLGRVQAMVPEVLGGIPTGWASPCAPYFGPQAGFFAVPPVGAGVWIEFEAGDTSRPVWVGGWWGQAEVPMKPGGGESRPTTKILRSDLGLIVALDDAAQTISVSDAAGVNQVVVDIATATIHLKGAAQVIVEAPMIKLGSQGAFHPAVLGDQLLSYLGQLVGIFNSHQHPGQFAGPVPVTPAPPLPPLTLPSILSTKVTLE